MRAYVASSLAAVLASALFLASCGDITPTSQPAVQGSPTVEDIDGSAPAPDATTSVPPTAAPTSTVTSVLPPTVATESTRASDTEEPAISSTPTSTPPEQPTPEATSLPEITRVVEGVAEPADAPSGPVLSPAELQGLDDAEVKRAIEDLSSRLQVDSDQIQIVQVQEETYRNSSLGCPQPDRFYLQVITSGTRVVLFHGGKQYDYRVAGSIVVLCALQEFKVAGEVDLPEGFWSRLAALPTARSEVAAAVVDGLVCCKVYVFGGFGNGATANEEYDVATDTWTKREPIPTRVDHAAAVSFEGKVYLIGGFNGAFDPVASVWAYDPVTDSWSRRADLPTARGGLGAAEVGGKIYAIGGSGGAGDVGTVEEYDPVADTWRARSPMPTPRDHVATTAVGGKIYVIGGRLGSFARNLDVNETYDPVTDTWEERAPLPTPRSGIRSAAVNGRIYVLGGEAVEGTFDTNERYDPETDSWIGAPPMPTARHGLAAVSIGSRIFALAGGLTPGGSDSALNEVFIVP